MRRLLCAVFASILVVPAAVAQTTVSPFTGTWKADTGTVRLPERPERWVLQNGRFRCETCDPAYDIKADGTDQPRPGDKEVDTTAVKVLSAQTVEMTDKKDGAVMETDSFTVSGDGTTLTIDVKRQANNSTGKVTFTRIGAAPSGAHAISGEWRATKLDQSDNARTFKMKGTADGLFFEQATGESWDAKYDGKDYPVKGQPGEYSVSLKKLNDRSVDETMKKDGKVVRVFHLRVSDDGKTLNIKSEGTEPGTTVTAVAVKQ